MEPNQFLMRQGLLKVFTEIVSTKKGPYPEQTAFFGEKEAPVIFESFFWELDSEIEVYHQEGVFTVKLHPQTTTDLGRLPTLGADLVYPGLGKGCLGGLEILLIFSQKMIKFLILGQSFPVALKKLSHSGYFLLKKFLRGHG